MLIINALLHIGLSNGFANIVIAALNTLGRAHMGLGVRKPVFGVSEKAGKISLLS